MFKRITTSLILTLLSGVSFASGTDVLKLDQVAWQPAGLKGAEMAVLWGSEAAGNAVWAFRLQPGVALPVHTHSNDYWGFALQGHWAHTSADGQTAVTAQDAYVRIPAGAPHADQCAGPEVCINIIQFKGARDIHFPPAK